MATPPSGLLGLHVLADDDARFPRDPVEQARCACQGGASVVQLRAKHTGDRQALAWGERIRLLTRDAGVLFFVNDRFDLALLLEADGVHLGQQDLAPQALPARARDRLRIGRSTHDPDQARRAAEDRVDYVAFGPLFETGSKDTGYPARGLGALSAVVEVVHQVAPIPVVAIGGIDAERAAQARDAGAGGVAVISAVAAEPDAAAAVAAVRRLADAARVQAA